MLDIDDDNDDGGGGVSVSGSTSGKDNKIVSIMMIVM